AGAAATLAGFAAHTASLVLRYLDARVTPVTNLHEVLSAFAWTVAGLSLPFQLSRRLRVLGAFALPLAAALMVTARSVPPAALPPDPVLRSFWLPVHVVSLFLGQALFALAACAGCMYLLQERALKARHGGWLARRLPSLEVLDRLNVRALTLGFPLLTIGILSGAIWAHVAWERFWTTEPKVVLSALTWVLYAVLLHGRLAAGWRGRRAALGAIAGFVAVLVTFVGASVFRAQGPLALT
ncbi:MAG TPA: cytochrome c biogenesis protein CcsA, partial [Thermodesulfobacteriota bacterium]|nr:cytochrome c biogenesis protein CcsA [Thermodesulfobacteriota bacterium]